MKNAMDKSSVFPLIRRSGFILAAAAAVLLTAASSQAQSVLTTHVREVVQSGTAQAIGRLPANQIMKLDLVLPLRDQAGLDSLLSEIYDPNSSSYRQFLTVQEFTERFGPSQQDYDAVVRFAKKSGFTVTGGTRDGMDVQIRGTVAAVEAAFHVNMLNYQHPTENRTFFSPDREPTVDLPFSLWHVTGLNNYSIPHPLFVKKSDYAAAHGISPEAVVSHATSRLWAFGFFPGQRHARRLLWRNGADRRWPEPGIARISRDRSGRFDEVFQQCPSNQPCADHVALHRWDQDILRG